jgi:CheY-like chemotaxis protein
MTKTKKTILIVEDNHDLRVSIRKALEDEGYVVLSATHGVDALEMLGKISSPALIVFDINVPMMSGDTFLAKIRQDVRLAHIPVMQVSDSDEPRRAATCCTISRTAPAAEFVTKIKAYFEKFGV